MQGKSPKQDVVSRPDFSFLRMKPRYFPIPSNKCGVLAQLVERLNGIEEVRGSNPLGSTSLTYSQLGEAPPEPASRITLPYKFTLAVKNGRP